MKEPSLDKDISNLKRIEHEPVLLKTHSKFESNNDKMLIKIPKYEAELICLLPVEK